MASSGDGDREADAALAYPRVYRPTLAYRIFFVVLGVIYVVLGLLTGPVLLAVFAIVGLWFVIAAARMRVTLYPDAIEVRNAFLTRRLRRDEIGAKAVRVYQLYPRARLRRPLWIRVQYRTDDALARWMADIPYADEDFLRQRRRGSLDR